MNPRDIKEKKITIGCRVNKETYDQMKKLSKKERWSMTQLSGVAIEYYLKLRGAK